MGKFGERLRSLRTDKGLSQMELSKQLKISKSSINMYERGDREPGIEMLERIADYFNVDMDYLLGKSDFTSKYDWLHSSKGLPANTMPVPQTRTVPLLGTIACGDPILAEQNIEGFLAMPEKVNADFCLRCKGDSMINARIFDGDIVYIRQQDTVENGEIAAVLIDGEATLKRVRLFDDHIALEPENPQYRPIVLWGAEMNDVRVLGKAVAFMSIVR